MRREERERLIRLLDYLESEVSEYPTFADLTWEIYQKDKPARRNVERWIENIVMSSIDLAKVLLASENRPIPDSYKETLYNIGLLGEFDEEFGRRLSKWAGLGNIVAHEYLDIRWKNIREFIKESEPAFAGLVKGVKKMLAQPDAQQK